MVPCVSGGQLVTDSEVERGDFLGAGRVASGMTQAFGFQISFSPPLSLGTPSHRGAVAARARQQGLKELS